MTDRFILQELLTQSLPFRVHNVKIDKLSCEQDLPMMFLAHFDTLSDDIKAQKNHLLAKHFNDKMTAAQACELLGLPFGTIKPATHIKLGGTTVIVLDDFPLAVHMQFTNTAKAAQTVYGNDLGALVQAEALRYLLTGNVNVLHKNTAKTLVSIDADDDEFGIAPSDSYTRLPNAHALATTHALNTTKDNSPDALRYLTDAIVAKVMDTFGAS